MVKYCLESKVITKDQVKWKIVSSIALKPNYFNKSIDQLLLLPSNLKKLGPNVLTGCMGSSSFTFTKTMFTDDFRQASTKYIEATTALEGVVGLKKSNVTIHEIEGEKKLYQVNQTEKYEKDIANNMVYHLILDLEAIELHKLKTLVERHGGQVTYLNTDACECWFDSKDLKGLDIAQYFWDNAQKIPKYKFENKPEGPKVERMKDFKHTNGFDFKKPLWRMYSDPLIDDFEPTAKGILDSKNSWNIDGIAGAGKTTMIRLIMKMLTERGERFQVLTPTNKSARVIGKDCMTIHKFLAKGFGNIQALKQAIKGLSYIILDEVSMIKETFYKIFLTIKKMANITFLVAGDFRQLEPVKDRGSFDYKYSLAFLELCDNNRLELTKCRRSDRQLFEDSLNVDNLDLNTYGKEECDVSICHTNKKRKEINAKWIEHYAKKADKTIKLKGLSYDDNSQDVEVFAGLPIIARINARSIGIFNNETFTVKKINKGTITITDEVEDKEIEIRQFQTLFHPAYCMTVHKVQGTTITKPFTIYQWKHFDTKMKYTSLTRSSLKAHVNIIA